MKKKKLGLALGAGGSRGIAHIGFLQALEEAEIVPDMIAGSSMGAVVGGCYAAGVSPSVLKQHAMQLNLGKIAAINLSLSEHSGIMQLKRARKMLASVIGEVTFEELKIPFACLATDLVTGTSVVLSHGNVLDAVLASGSIPGVFTSARVGEYEHLSDGGILERVPTKQVKAMGADVVGAVDVLGALLQKEMPNTPLGTVLRYIDILDGYNTARTRESRDYIDLWLEPALGDMDQYKVKDLDFAYEKGYELGKDSVGDILALLG